MDDVKHPTKEQVRLYMEQRQAEREVPPPIEEFRCRLKWNFESTRATAAYLNMACRNGLSGRESTLTSGSR
jgi:hypothetical protein